VPTGATTPGAPGAVPTSLGGSPPATWNPTAAKPPSSSAAPTSGGGTATAGAVAERLRKLDKLRDDGAITPAEHATERARILDQI
jgi:hypothetical protein